MLLLQTLLADTDAASVVEAPIHTYALGVFTDDPDGRWYDA